MVVKRADLCIIEICQFGEQMIICSETPDYLIEIVINTT